MNAYDSIKDKKLVVYLGNGGVGKTTVSAATALEAADRGEKTLVMTVDPARRLADSLGIQYNGSKEVKVPGTDNLYALMIDTKITMDELMQRYIDVLDCSEERKDALSDKVFKNRFYKKLTDHFAGSQEFITIGKVYDLLEEKKYDKIIVDTAPARHAVDFLNMSTRVVSMFDSNLVKAVMYVRTKSSWGKKLMDMGIKKFMKKFKEYTSPEFIDDFLDFFELFDPLIGGLEERAREMEKILKDKDKTICCLVTSPNQQVVSETQYLANTLDILKLGFGYVAVNKVSTKSEFDELLLSDPTLMKAFVDSLTTKGVSDEVAKRFIEESFAASHLN